MPVSAPNLPIGSIGCAALATAALACAAPAQSAFVSAPSEGAPAGTAVSAVPRARENSSGGRPKACDRSWRLGDVADGAGRVVVVCGSDVRREPLDDSGPMARMLLPALEPARAGVCACVDRLAAPPFVDLVFTARPESGQVTVVASEVDDLDPELGPPFIACVGKVVVRFQAWASDACSGGAGRGGDDKVVVVYPARVDLAP